MKRRQEPETQSASPAEAYEAAQQDEQMQVELPILPTQVGIAKLDVAPDQSFAILNMSTPLGTQMYALDRSQCVELGAKLMKLGEKMPRPPKRLEVVERPPLVVPE